MTPRDRLLYATSALLYSGPLYAGLAGYGFETLPLFAAFFMAWLFILRPGDWPESAADWRVPRALAWPLLIFGVQMVVVGFCLAVGSALGGVYALTLPMPLAAPVGISLAGILIAWALGRQGGGTLKLRVPGEGLEIGSGILDVARPVMPGRKDAQGFVEDVAEMLADLGSDPAAGADIDRLAELVAAKDMSREMFEALESADALEAPFVQLWIRVALSSKLVPDLLGQGRIAKAVDRAIFSGNEKVAEEAARLAAERLAETASLADEFPPASRLRLVAQDGGAAAAALADLADALDPPSSR